MAIQFKRSAAINQPPEPTHLAPGELAINLADKKLYTKNDKNEIINIGFNDSYADSTFLKRSGGTMSGPILLFEGTMPSKTDEVVSKRYVDSKFGAGADQVLPNGQLGTTYVKRAGATMTGKLRLEYDVTTADDQYHAVHKKFTEASYLKISGGNVTGNLVLTNAQNSQTPGNALITRDFATQTYLSLSGGEMQGILRVRTPTSADHAATKTYVDDVRNYAYPKAGGDLSGPMTATGPVTSTDANGLRIAYGGYGSFWRNDGSNFYLLFTNQGTPWNTWNGLRPFYANLSTGRVTMENGLTVSTDLYVGGGINANTLYARAHADVNDILIRSDRTLKRDFQPLENAVDKICSISASTYYKKGKTKREAGLIAQEVEQILPEAVDINEDGNLSIYPMGIVALLVKAVQELKAEIDELKKNQK